VIRAYLSSYRLGRRAGVLRWTGAGAGRALIVMNALDLYGARRASWEREAADLRSLGYTAAELDLREPGDLTARLVASDLVWVVGGNAFVEGVDVMDDHEVGSAGTPDAPASTLGLIDHRIVPHWRSDHPESASEERAVAELERRGLAYVALRDGDDLLLP